MSNYITLWKTWTEIPPFKLPSTDKEFSGYSLAGLRTNFFVKPDLMLDAGISADERSKVYFNENEFLSLIFQSNLVVNLCDLEPY